MHGVGTMRRKGRSLARQPGLVVQKTPEASVPWYTKPAPVPAAIVSCSTSACGTFSPFRAKFGMVRYWGQIDRAEAIGMARSGGSVHDQARL